MIDTHEYSLSDRRYRSGRRLFGVLMTSICLALPCSAQMLCPSVFESAAQFKTENPIDPGVAQQIADSGNFRLFEGREEYEMDSETFEIGEGYIVIGFKGKIIIGADYVGKYGDTRRTHPVVWKQVNRYDGQVNQSAEAPFGSWERDTQGAIRFRAKNILEVAGYHTMRKSIKAAKNIAQIFRRACPNLIIYVTGGRLSDPMTEYIDSE